MVIRIRNVSDKPFWRQNTFIQRLKWDFHQVRHNFHHRTLRSMKVIVFDHTNLNMVLRKLVEGCIGFLYDARLHWKSVTVYFDCLRRLARKEAWRWMETRRSQARYSLDATCGCVRWLWALLIQCVCFVGKKRIPWEARGLVYVSKSIRAVFLS